MGTEMLFPGTEASNEGVCMKHWPCNLRVNLAGQL